MNRTEFTKNNKLLNRCKTVWDIVSNSPKLYLLACFLVPLLLMWIIFIIRGVYPFGEKSVLVLDLNGQYVYFFEAMRDVFEGDSSPFYTWYRALSGEFSGMYAYYLASPFSLLTVLFPEDGITEALLAITLLKCGSMGLTFGYYLHKRRPSKPVAVIMFSTMYALSSYAFVQAMNTMWMDALIYLPLIVLGLEVLVDRGKFVLYTVMLALCFIANFYIGFMVAIFVVVYFLYYYVSTYKMGEFSRFFFAFYKWALFSVIAAAIAAIIILPTFYSLEFGKNDFSNPTFTFKAKFDFMEILTQMMPNSYDTVRPEGLPFIYCGLVSLLLLPAYFLTDKIKGRRKIMSGVILGFMVLSFTGSTIDLFWHGMQRPNWLNYRYSFMFCFLVLVFAYDAYRFLKPHMYRIILGTGAFLIGFCVLVQKMIEPDGEFSWLYLKAETNGGYEPGILLTVWFWIIMTGVLTAILWSVTKRNSRVAPVLLCCVVCFELFVNGIYDMFKLHDDVYYSTRTSYVEYFDRWRGLTEEVQSRDLSLYRMEKTVFRKVNDNMTLRIRGISGSTSTLNASVITLLNKMGYASKSHWSRYVGTNPVGDSLLGIKYILTDDPSDMPPEYGQMIETPDPTSKNPEDSKKLYAYINRNALPMLYGVDDGIKDYDWDAKNEDGKVIDLSAPDILNRIVSAMIGYDIQIYKPVEVTDVSTNGVREAYADGYTHKKYAVLTSGEKGTVEYTFTVEDTSDIYIHFPSKYPRDTTLRIKDDDLFDNKEASFVSKGSYMTNETHTILHIGEYEKGHEVTVQLNMKADDLYFYADQDYIFYFDKEAFDEAMTELSKSKIKVTDFDDTHIEGTINISDGDTTVFTSIPYDKGWTVKVDGERVELEKSLDSLLCFTVSEGEHTIEMSYIPQGFIIGAAACVFGITVLVILGIFDFKKRKKRKNEIMALLHNPESTYSKYLEKLKQQELSEESIPDDADESDGKTEITGDDET